MHTIESNELKVSIAAKGAELKSIWHKEHGLEYLWNADPAFWAKTSPVLFPIIGTLKNNRYEYNGKEYHLPRHGFARDKEFTVTERAESSIRFTITSDDSTLEVYPFPFRFSIRYTVQGSELSVQYEVENQGSDPMLFSVGGHPAFKVPVVDGTTYNDYTLVFEKEENAPRWPITADGLIDTTPQPLLQGTKELPLRKELFAKDAIVLKGLKSRFVQLQSGKTPRGLKFYLEGFPYLGLWAAPGADFLCIEPWCGIADSVEADGQLAHKEGVQQLGAGAEYTVAWRVLFY